MNATDVDTGLSGAVTYELVGDSLLFSISSGLGVITIAGDLDYEMQQTYQVTLHHMVQYIDNQCYIYSYISMLWIKEHHCH